MLNQHSILPPSSAARRVACPGSRKLESLYPRNENSESAKEGETAHWVASNLLKKKINSLREPTPFINLSDRAENGELITSEMIECAHVYLNAIAELITLRYGMFEAIPSPNLFYIEEVLDISNIHPLSWGTPDCWFFLKDEIFIWDYKYGHGFVEVFENWQLISYAAGIINTLNNRKSKLNILKIKTVHMCIVQPRSYHKEGPVRTWTISVDELQPYLEVLKRKEYEAMSDSAECNPSPQCTYCSARHACFTLQKSSLATVDLSEIAATNDLTSNQLGSELRYLKKAQTLLDARITGLEEQTISKIKAGENVPFFTLEESAGRDKWKLPSEKIITMGEIMGVDLSKPQETITPKQAIKKGLPEKIVKDLSESVKGAVKLVESNPRKIFKGKL